MRKRKALVMGASGFVGSHVVRQLVERGDDARAMLPDPAPLIRTNVDGLRRVLDIAADADLLRFVYLSTIGTIAVSTDGSAVTEDTPFNWADKGGPYIEARRTAEDMVHGPGDWQPTPHGGLIARAALGTMPFYVKGVTTEVVGVEDAARALLLGAERGRIGERYIVSESYRSMRELGDFAAAETGVPATRFGVPLAVLYAAAYLVEPIRALRPRKITPILNVVRLAATTSPADHGKATRELGWQPTPVADAIRRAARFYVERRSADYTTTRKRVDQ